MNAFEFALVGSLVLLIGGALWRAYTDEDRSMFWNPLTLFSVIFAYYFVIGPLIALGFGGTFAYGTDLRPSMWEAWLAGLLGLASIFAGFSIRARKFPVRLVTELTPEWRARLGKYALGFFAVGFVGFGYDYYTSGQSLASLLLPFHEGAAGADVIGREGLAAGNYLFLLINAFIPAMCLQTMRYHDARWLKQLLFLGLPLVVTGFFYTSLGFRHRIVIMVLSIAATRYLMRRQRPNLLVLAGGLAGIVLLAGLIVMTRTYGQGLDLSQVSGLSVTQIFLSGFNDAGTFFTTALVIDAVPATFPFTGLDPLWVALTIPIPRALWPEKPYPVFLQYFESLTGTQGQAVPITGEHYMMFGWPGIVVGGLIVGLIYRSFWDFYRANPRNPMVVVVYAVSWGLIFPVVNRGYLAQTLMEFFFDLLPLVVLYLVVKKRMLLTSALRSARSTTASRPAAFNLRDR